VSRDLKAPKVSKAQAFRVQLAMFRVHKALKVAKAFKVKAFKVLRERKEDRELKVQAFKDLRVYLFKVHKDLKELKVSKALKD
jgi:hypothetical protein